MPADRFSICAIYFYDIKTWPFHEQKPSDQFMNVDRLISSLTKLIEYYPILSGLIHTDEKDKSTSVIFDTHQGGILFNSLSTNIALTRIPLSFDEDSITAQLCESLRVKNNTDVPILFQVNHTRFQCGSVALTIHLNHGIADGHSYFQLIRDWTKIYQNFEYQPIVCHERSLLQRVEAHPRLAKPYQLKPLQENIYTVLKEIPSAPFSPSKSSVRKIFRFSAAELERMKIEATSALSSDVDYVSTFDVLTAHLYRYVALARHCSPTSIAKLYISTDIRSRLQQPTIPLNYFGNAVVFSYLESEFKDLIRLNSLGLWASRIRQAILRTDSDEIKTILSWIRDQPDKSKIIATCNPNETDLLVSGGNKMDVHSNCDFEVGVRPCRVLAPSGSINSGVAILAPTELADGSIDVILALEEDAMEELEKNSEFRKYREM